MGDPGAVERMVDATAELPVDAYDSTVAIRLRRVPVDEYEISAMLAAGGGAIVKHGIDRREAVGGLAGCEGTDSERLPTSSDRSMRSCTFLLASSDSSPPNRSSRSTSCSPIESRYVFTGWKLVF